MTANELDRAVNAAPLRALVERHRDDIKAVAARDRAAGSDCSARSPGGTSAREATSTCSSTSFRAAPCSSSCISSTSWKGFFADVVAAGKQAWDTDRVRQLAVERLLEIIGESARAMTDAARAPSRSGPGLDHRHP
jgi:hypothetical protein